MNTPALKIDGIIIPVTLDTEHEYTLSTAQTAEGYGVSPKTIRNHKSNHADELVEGKHFIGAQNMGSGNLMDVTHWTKRGIIRLGFFIKSERAKRFRDMAEDLIVDRLDQPEFRHPLPTVPEMVAAKIAAFAVRDAAGADVLRMLVDLHRDITEPAPKSVQPVEAPAPTVDEKTMAVARWLVQLATVQAEVGLEERQYTMPELLAKCPPIPANLPNKSVSLGLRLAMLAGLPIPMDAGRKLVIVPTRNRNGSRWLLQVSQVM
jgi:hypothetical protein